MSFVIAVPEFLSAAATDLANLGSTISAANAAASIPTTGVLAAGADDVSAAIAALRTPRRIRRSARRRRRFMPSSCRP